MGVSSVVRLVGIGAVSGIGVELLNDGKWKGTMVAISMAVCVAFKVISSFFGGILGGAMVGAFINVMMSKEKQPYHHILGAALLGAAGSYTLVS